MTHGRPPARDQITAAAAREWPSERALDLFEVEALDQVGGLDVLEALEGHAAFLAGGDFVHLVLEPLQGLQHAELEHHHAVTDDPDARALADRALGDAAAGHLA